MNDYGVEHGVSWGSANKTVQDTWINRKCNLDKNVATGTCHKGKQI